MVPPPRFPHLLPMLGSTTMRFARCSARVAWAKFIWRRDMRLHRKVALKILPAAVAANQDRMRRFEQEATAAAALNHPHIAHIYEIGEAEGVNFIAMEFVDGKTLREKIHLE